MVVGLGGADDVEVAQVLVEGVGIAVEELVLVHRAVRRALAGGAVVRAVEDQRVVELTGLLEIVEDAPDLHVGVLAERGERLGEATEQPLLVVVEFTPRTHVVRRVGHVLGNRVERGQLGALGQDAAFDHPGEHPLAVGLVAVVEHAPVLVEVLPGSVVGRVGGTRAVPQVPGLGRIRRILVAQHPDRLIGKILGQVIALLGGVGRFDEAIVLDQVRIPLIGLTTHEPVEAVEALLQRPLRAARAARNVLLGHVVVLADPERAVPVVLQDLPDRRALGRKTARRSGKTVGGLRDRRAPVDVVISSGQDCRAGG